MRHVMMPIVMSLLLSGCERAAEQSKVDTSGIATSVVTREDAKTQINPWGDLITYQGGSTYGTKDVLAAVAEIKPGQEIHPPHVHAEEEYMYILEGTGTWYLKDQTQPAKSGDMFYARPWDRHGLKNTGTSTLKFVVWKWNSKGVPLAVEPTKH